MNRQLKFPSPVNDLEKKKEKKHWNQKIQKQFQEYIADNAI